MSSESKDGIAAELQRKRQELTSLQSEVVSLELASKIRDMIPGCSAADIERAARIVRRLEGEQSEPTGNGKKASSESLNGKTIEEAAKIILGEAGTMLHYAVIAKRALARGYSSGRQDSSAEKVTRSFAQTLLRIANTTRAIERAGNGHYRLPAK